MGQAQQAVIYGADDRADVYAHASPELRTLATQSTVALFATKHLDESNPTAVRVNANSLATQYNLCSTERFRSDPTGALCSGTLIDDDLVLTAGHCITSAADCAKTRFVFRYQNRAANTLESLTSEDVFGCTALVAHKLGTYAGKQLDYAVVRLDRKATPRFVPAAMRLTNAYMGAGEGVSIIGFPSGIPAKIDSGGSIRDPRSAQGDYFVATTDSFRGNSGSGVYVGNQVAGVLVRGETDYVSAGSCNVAKVCGATSCRGEDVQYVQPALEDLFNTTGHVPISAALTTTATVATADRLEIFYRGLNNGLWRLVYDNRVARWLPEQHLGGYYTSGPAAVNFQGMNYVFGRDASNQLLVSQTNDTGITATLKLGGILTSAPTAVATADRLEVFYRGLNNHVWRRVYDGTRGGWQPEQHIGGILTSAPSAAVFNGTIHVFGRGLNHHLWMMKVDASGLTYEEDRGGILTSAAGVTVSPNRLEIFYRGLNNHYWRQVYDNRVGWIGEHDLGGIFSSAPSAAYFNGRTHLFGRGQFPSLWMYKVEPSGVVFTQDLGGLLN
ncbi:MAG: trypsin-like peptidase domain-containing protein [Myxococcales bacterium]|nr:trypsin-like peptidase domain-containing protein [Myxococcales bacterium]